MCQRFRDLICCLDSDLLLPKLKAPPPSSIYGLLIEFIESLLAPLPLSYQRWCEGIVELASFHARFILNIINVLHCEKEALWLEFEGKGLVVELRCKMERSEV